jgi:hypothetical protein
MTCLYRMRDILRHNSVLFVSLHDHVNMLLRYQTKSLETTNLEGTGYQLEDIDGSLWFRAASSSSSSSSSDLDLMHLVPFEVCIHQYTSI